MPKRERRSKEGKKEGKEERKGKKKKKQGRILLQTLQILSIRRPSKNGWSA
jgi:hypothetical protein